MRLFFKPTFCSRMQNVPFGSTISVFNSDGARYSSESSDRNVEVNPDKNWLFRQFFVAASQGFCYCKIRVKPTMLLVFIFGGSLYAQGNKNNKNEIKQHIYQDSSIKNVALAPYNYSDSFPTRDENAWAAYPLWQDNAYDPNFRIGRIVPGDNNLSIIAKVTPYSHVDNYAGAQKLLDMYLVPGAFVKFRYYLKVNQPVDFLKIRFAAGQYGKIDFTIPHPETNKWVWAKVDFEEFIRQNPSIAGLKKIRIYALAFLAKIPEADPAMPIYMGLDDITFKGAKEIPFHFIEPVMYKLPEFQPYISQRAYNKEDIFRLSGEWPVEAKRVELKISSYTDSKIIYTAALHKEGERWVLKPVKLSFPEGLYLGKLIAYKGSVELSETKFTIHISPENIRGNHPRLLFNSQELSLIKERLKTDSFQSVNDSIRARAIRLRNEIPLSSIIFDLDQFPDKNWLPTWNAFGDHIYNTGDALRWNAFAYAFDGDTAAGNYARDILLKLSAWPSWTSPWLIKHGIYDDHRMGTWSTDVALAYHLMTSEESKMIRDAIMKQIIKGCYRTWVYNNYVTSNTSNWIAHTVGGALMNLSAMYDDGQEFQNMEPYFTGLTMKLYNYITHVTDTVGGAWGEGYGYNNYSLLNLQYSLPSLDHVFHIDLSYPLIGTYKEYVWGGLIKDKKWFSYGDSDDTLTSADNWAFLLSTYKKPLLSWFYNYLKDGETLNDLLFDTRNIPQQNPFDKNPDKVFPMIGTTVFKSGWGKNDFVFDMRTGAFFNHQHLDQGSFYLADHGITFIEDQPIKNSDYYKDPLYQSDFTQPIAHSTILIDHNPQSQRVGDLLNFAPGFDDHAYIEQYLDGKIAAFSRGNIGRLYWGKVKSLTRNVLYLKPDAILMLDVAVPVEKNVDVTLLYHTKYLKEIDPGSSISKITKDGYSLNIIHLAPDSILVKAVETPHFLNTLLREKPLIKEGMLTVSARTHDRPLVMANVFTVTESGIAPDVKSKQGNGFVNGEISGKRFVFSTDPGHLYHLDHLQTDALVMTWDSTEQLVAMATILKRDNNIILKTAYPSTFDLSEDTVKYYTSEPETIMIRRTSKPSVVLLNGKPVRDFRYDEKGKMIKMEINKGEGIIIFKE